MISVACYLMAPVLAILAFRIYSWMIVDRVFFELVLKTTIVHKGNIEKTIFKCCVLMCIELYIYIYIKCLRLTSKKP